MGTIILTGRLRFDDGTACRLSQDEARSVSEELWLLGGSRRGALTAATKLAEARERPFSSAVEFDRQESSLVRELVEKVRNGSGDRR